MHAYKWRSFSQIMLQDSRVRRPHWSPGSAMWYVVCRQSRSSASVARVWRYKNLIITITISSRKLLINLDKISTYLVNLDLSEAEDSRLIIRLVAILFTIASHFRYQRKLPCRLTAPHWEGREMRGCGGYLPPQFNWANPARRRMVRAVGYDESS